MKVKFRNPGKQIKRMHRLQRGLVPYFDSPSYPVGTPGASPANYIPGQTISCTLHNTKKNTEKRYILSLTLSFQS